MSDLQTFEQLLAEVGPLFDEVELIEQISEDTWGVMFDETTAIEVHCDTVGHKLSFSMPLGPVVPGMETEMYRTLLAYNFLRRDTGGFYMALDGSEDGDVFLMLDVYHLELDANALAGILATVLETGETWRDVLHGEEYPEEADEEEEASEDGLTDAIKV